MIILSRMSKTSKMGFEITYVFSMVTGLEKVVLLCVELYFLSVVNIKGNCIESCQVFS